jgi:hypothetical protein
MEERAEISNMSTPAMPSTNEPRTTKSGRPSNPVSEGTVPILADGATGEWNAAVIFHDPLSSKGTLQSGPNEGTDKSQGHPSRVSVKPSPVESRTRGKTSVRKPGKPSAMTSKFLP